MFHTWALTCHPIVLARSLTGAVKLERIFSLTLLISDSSFQRYVLRVFWACWSDIGDLRTGSEPESMIIINDVSSQLPCQLPNCLNPFESTLVAPLHEIPPPKNGKKISVRQRALPTIAESFFGLLLELLPHWWDGTFPFLGGIRWIDLLDPYFRMKHVHRFLCFVETNSSPLGSRDGECKHQSQVEMYWLKTLL